MIMQVIWDPTQLQPGDILVSGGGKYGHTGVVPDITMMDISLYSLRTKAVNLAQVVVQCKMSLTSHSKTSLSGVSLEGIHQS